MMVARMCDSGWSHYEQSVSSCCFVARVCLSASSDEASITATTTTGWSHGAPNQNHGGKFDDGGEFGDGDEDV